MRACVCVSVRACVLACVRACLHACVRVCFLMQEKRLLEEGGSGRAPEVYYVPTAADAFVSAYRVWLKRFAGGGVEYPSYVEKKLPETPSKKVMLDR